MLAVAPRPKLTHPRRALTAPGCRPMIQPTTATGASMAARAAKIGTRKARERLVCHRPRPAASANTKPPPSAHAGGRRKAQAGRLLKDRRAKKTASPPPTRPAVAGTTAPRLKRHSDPPSRAAARNRIPASAPMPSHASPQINTSVFCRSVITPTPPTGPASRLIARGSFSDCAPPARPG